MRGPVALHAFVAAAALWTGGAHATPVPLHFDCRGPITQNMSATAILAAFGRNARREVIPGAEGERARAVVLYPGDPSRRLEITFWDDAQTAVAAVTAGPGGTAWTGPLGLHVGSAMAEVVTANGHNFSFNGFGWDYGGYLTSFWNGNLLKQGCAVQVRLGLPAGVKPPRSITGEREMNSTLVEVKAADPRIDTLSVGWPLPAGVQASGR